MMINAIITIVAGLIVGFLIGLTGMGGGALMTPFLLIVMKFDPVLAVGTDLTFAALTKIIGGIQHRRENNVSFRRVMWMAAGSVPASFIGAQFILRQTENRALIENIMPHLLGSTLVVVSMIILARTFRILGPNDDIEVKWPAPWALVITGAIGGVMVGMTSIGGGTIIMALLLVFFSIPMNYMVGLDVVHGALLTVITSLNYMMAGQTDWSLIGLLLIGSLPGAWLGAKATNRIDRRIVRTILAILVMGAGFNLLMGKG